MQGCVIKSFRFAQILESSIASVTRMNLYWRATWTLATSNYWKSIATILKKIHWLAIVASVGEIGRLIGSPVVLSTLRLRVIHSTPI